MRSKLTLREGLTLGAAVLPLLVALTASAALLVDYLRPSPVFCAEGGGCEAIKHTNLASMGGLPTPVFGLFGFSVLLLLALLRGPLPRGLHGLVALVGASIAAGLIAAQFSLGEYCVYCLVVDGSALLGAGVAIWRYKTEWDPPSEGLVRGGVGALSLVIPAVTMALGFTARASLPPLILAELDRPPKGVATVVEFVDFECPYCREEYSDLAPMLSKLKDKVRVVRKLVPLTRIHPHALDAAKAACCGEELGKGDAMADALFHAPIDDLTPEGCEKIATELGLDPARYSACVQDPKTRERLASDRDEFDHTAAKGDGLPLLWIGERKMMGAQSAEALRRALEEALAKTGS